MLKSWSSAVPDGPRQHDIRLAIVINSYPPRLGGLESHVFQLASELRGAGIHVVVICLAPRSSDTVENGVRVVRLRMHLPIASVISFPSWGTTRRLANLFREENITVVSTHTRFFPMSYVGLRAACRARIPVIHTEHGAGFVKTPSRIIRAFSRIVDLTMGKVVLRKASAVLAVSQPSAVFVSHLAGVDSEIFPNALQLEYWPPLSEATQVCRPQTIAFLGRLVGGKGWETFVDAAAELIYRRGFEDLIVNILGDGPDLDALRARIHARGLDESVVFHGHADVQTIRAVLRGSVLVNPSRLAEGFQVTLLEAVAAGAQIVSYPVPSIAPLRADGGPVRETSGESFAALVDCVVEALNHPLPPMPRSILETRWSWKTRSREYLAIAQRVVAAAH